MVQIKCPRCKSDLEIEEYKVEEGDVRIGAFCKKEKCFYHKNPLVGIERKTSKVFISESLM